MWPWGSEAVQFCAMYNPSIIPVDNVTLLKAEFNIVGGFFFISTVFVSETRDTVDQSDLTKWGQSPYYLISLLERWRICIYPLMLSSRLLNFSETDWRLVMVTVNIIILTMAIVMFSLLECRRNSKCFNCLSLVVKEESAASWWEISTYNESLEIQCFLSFGVVL